MQPRTLLQVAVGSMEGIVVTKPFQTVTRRSWAALSLGRVTTHGRGHSVLAPHPQHLLSPSRNQDLTPMESDWQPSMSWINFEKQTQRAGR